MMIRGGGDPCAAMAFRPRFRMGPPPRSFAADAQGCIMVGAQSGPPNTRLWRDDPRPIANSPWIAVSRFAAKLPLMRRRAGEDARHQCSPVDIKSPVQGCAKAARRT